MKRIFSAAVFLLSSAFVFAELHKPNRIFEVGFDAEGGFSNNSLAATELLVKDLVLDLQKMADDVPDSGWNLDLFVREKNFLNINAGQRFRLGFFAGVEGNGNFNISHDFFDIFGTGYKVGESKSIDLDTYGDVYLTGGVSFGTRIRKLGIRITPSYYVPIVYIPKTNATVSWSTTEDGEIRAHAQAEFEVYSAFDLSKVLEDSDYENVSDEELSEEIQKSLSNGGFDLQIEAEYPLFGNAFELGAFARVPILPGKLNYKASRTITADFYQSNFLGKLNDESETESEHDFGEFSYSTADKEVYRPMRLGLEGVWRPFGGTWFALEPMAACVIRSPYDADERIVYPEFSLDARLNFFNFLGLNVGTAYLDQIFVQRVGLMLNARVIEIDAQVSLRSGTFEKSFKGAGLGAYLGFRVGL